MPESPFATERRNGAWRRERGTGIAHGPMQSMNKHYTPPGAEDTLELHVRRRVLLSAIQASRRRSTRPPADTIAKRLKKTAPSKGNRKQQATADEIEKMPRK